MPASDFDPQDSPDANQPTRIRPGTQPSAPSASHYAVELPYAEELQQMLGGAYMVEGFLGQGGMGAVYKGLQMPLKRPVAIKILQKRQAAGGEDEFAFEERFKREAYAMAALTHPNIVQVYDCGDAGENFLFISMELLEGGDLSDVIKAGAIPEEKALKLICQICDGMQAAHERGIVHRDIKPANIFLTADGRAKVADFGLAKKFDVKSTFVTKTGLGMGTPDYAAPEQYEPEMGIDHRADIYALGVMMYQMLTGRLPRGVYKMPSQMVAVDARIDDIVAKAMMSEREERWQSAAEIKKAILGLATHPPKAAAAAAPVRTGTVSTPAKPAVSARPASQPAVRTAAMPTARPAAVVPAAPPPKKSSAGLIVVIIATVAVLAVGAFLLTKKTPPAPEAATAGPSSVPAPSGTTPSEVPPTPFRPDAPGEKWVDGLSEWWAKSGGNGLLAKTDEGYVFTRRGDLQAGSNLQNVALRATVRKINWYTDLRVASHKPSSTGSQQGLSWNMMVRNGGELGLFARAFQRPAEDQNLGKLKMPPGFDPTARFELELRISNGVARAFLNGQQKFTSPVQDHGPGFTGLAGGEGMIVERFQYLDLGGGSGGDSKPSPAILTVASNGEWVDALPVILGRSIPDGYVKEGSTLRAQRLSEVTIPDVSLENVAVRVTARVEQPSSRWDITLRATPSRGNFYKAILYRAKYGLLVRYEDNKTTNLLRFNAPSDLSFEKSHTMEFRAQGSRLAVLVNDKEVGAVQDDRFASGKLLFMGAEGTIFEKLEYRSLPALAASSASETPAPPGQAKVSASTAMPGAINLLEQVKLPMDSVSGEWRMENGELIGNGPYARIAFKDYQPPAEYDFRVTFTREPGGNSVMQHIVRSGRDISWLMGGFGASVWGFEMVGNDKANKNRTTVIKPLENGRRYESLVRVRRDRVTVLVDGVQIVDFESDGSDWNNGQSWVYPDISKLGVGCQGRATFHSAEVVPFVDGAAPAATAATTPLPPPPTVVKQVIDLIPLVDPGKDRINVGTANSAYGWEKSANVLSFRSEGSPGKILAPLSLANVRDYEVGVVVRRFNGNTGLNLDVPIWSGRQCMISLFTPDITLAPVESQQRVLARWPADATGDVRVVARVRRNADDSLLSVSVSVNSRPCGQWEGASWNAGRSSSPHPDFPGSLCPGLYSLGNSFFFSAWQIRVYEGEATVLREAAATEANGPAPAMTAASGPAHRDSLKLFDGRSLNGWKIQGPPDSFSVEDGCIKAMGPRANIMFTGLPGINPIFKDFVLSMKVKTVNQANSGVWIHAPRSGGGATFNTGLEAQIANENRDKQKTGSLFSIVAISEMPAHDDKWFDYRIEVRDSTITTFVDGKKIMSWTQPRDWQPPKPNLSLSEGGIGLQSNGGQVWFKDIEITVP